MATTSLVLGIVSLGAWFIPFFGFPVTIAGIVTGIIAVVKDKSRGKAVVGIALSSVGLIATFINSVMVFSAFNMFS